MTENFIRYYDNMLDQDTCDSIIDYTKLLNDAERYKISSNDSRYYLRFRPHLYESNYHNKIYDAIKNSFNLYTKEFNLDYLSPEQYSEDKLNYKMHYNPAGQGFIDWHDDHGGVSENSFRRSLVFILYLQDLDEGELQFKYFSDVKVMPKAGRILWMPTMWPYIHKANLVKKDKFIITGFYQK
jgi:hypothetical protein